MSFQGIPAGATGGPDTALGAIRRVSSETGGDFAALVRMASLESGLDADAAAATSSARGLFQFTRGTWLDMVERHGGNYGLADEAAALQQGADARTQTRILALRDDPEVSARMAHALANDNRAVLEARLGGSIGESDLYLAHFLGAGAAAEFIAAERAGQGASAAAEMFPRAAAANRPVFFDAAGHARSLEEVRGFFERKLASVTVPDRAATAARPFEAPDVAAHGRPPADPAAGTGAGGSGPAFGWLRLGGSSLISMEARMALAELPLPGGRDERGGFFG